MLKSNVLFIVVIVAMCSASLNAASIKGKVMKPDGQPAAFFKVEIVRVFANQISETMSSTDQDGNYAALGLKEGEYVLFAYDNTLQYPSRRDMFMDDKPLRFALGATEDREANITLPNPAVMVTGTVHVGNRKDTVSLCHKGQEWRSATIKSDETGTFRYIVPADEELSISIINDSGTVTFSPFSFSSGDKPILNLEKAGVNKSAVPCKPFGS